METTLAAVYCEGWDGGIVNPLTPDEAESRDSAGEPYSVVLLAGGRLHSVLNISWAEGYCAVLRYDVERRLIASHEWRRAREGDLFLRESATWAIPSGADLPQAAQHRTSWQLNGRRSDSVQPAGERGGLHTFADSGFAPPRLPIPAFGRWKALLDSAARVHAEACTEQIAEACAVPREIEGPFRVVDADIHGLPVRTATERPWQPPRPLQPRNLDDLFRDGAERAVGDRRMRISTHPAGKLNLPSGRLVAADPSSLDYGEEPFLVTVEPGTYPVTISLATFTDDPGHTRVAAARLDITDRRPVRWELALRDDQDLLDLGYGEFFGFGVDAGLACFVDEDNREPLSAEWESLELRDPRFANVAAGDMVAWSSGWGDGAYPTWVGRAPSGQITTFIADMLLFPRDR